MEKATPADKDLKRSNFVLTGRVKDPSISRKYDRGPDSTFAKLLFNSLNKQEVLTAKAKYQKDMDKLVENYFENRKIAKPNAENKKDAYNYAIRKLFDKHNLAAFDFKSHPDAGFFGHYRGTFDAPEVVILADPHGYDSFITSKALTGARGQYIQGMMDDMGVGNKYLVIKTVPMAMDGASSSEWNAVLKKTRDYRKGIFAEIYKRNKDVLFIADGKFAAQELPHLIEKDGDFVTLKRRSNNPGYGIEAANDQIREFSDYSDVTLFGQMSDIPREHLTWIARVWEGTSGDRVITASNDSFKGKAFAIVAPNWARRNTVHYWKHTADGIESMVDKLVDAGEPQPKESLEDFVQRRRDCASKYEIANKKSSKKKCGLAFNVDIPGVLFE